MNTIPPKIQSLLAEHVDRSGDCWTWTRAKTPAGYGAINSTEHGYLYTHRVAYELANGPIPEGKTVDHTCHNDDPDCPGGACIHRSCCNPAHLEAVSRKTNSRRGKSAWGINAQKTHCIHGHEFDAANTRVYVTRSGNRGRSCRTCHRITQGARYHASKGARRSQPAATPAA